MHMNQLPKKLPILASAMTCIILVFCSVQTLAAITKGYSTDDAEVRPGLVVALSENSTSDNPKVERAAQDQAERVIGVATTVDESLVIISSGKQETYIEMDGEVAAYVTNLDGDIRQGDLLSLSPLKGILTKAVSSEPVIAIAVEDFDRSKTEVYTIQDGPDKKEVLIQRLRVSLDRKAVTNPGTLQDQSPLSKLGQAVAGKEVSEIRVIVGLIIFFIVLVAEGSIIYGAFSSAIGSLGRNPMARNIIIKELVRVLFVAIAVLVLGVAAIYAILAV